MFQSQNCIAIKITYNAVYFLKLSTMQRRGPDTERRGQTQAPGPDTERQCPTQSAGARRRALGPRRAPGLDKLLDVSTNTDQLFNVFIRKLNPY